MSSDLEGRCFVKKGNVLYPVDFAASELLATIPEGKEVVVVIRQHRNPKALRWFFAMLRTVCQATGLWATEENLLNALKFETGHCELQMKLDGSECLVAKSISFPKMKEDEFNAFKERSLDLLATKVLGCDPAELMEEVDRTQRAA